MQNYLARFAPVAGVLAVAMLFGGPSVAQTGGASNAIPNAGSKQDPPVDKPAVVKTTKEERAAARAKRKAEVAGGVGASNAIPNAGSNQDPPVDKPTGVKTTKAERAAARAQRRAEVAKAGGASNAIPNAGAKQDPPVDKTVVK